MKDRARPWRSILALGLAVAAAAISHEAGKGFSDWLQPGSLVAKVVTIATAAGFCPFATIAVAGFSC